MHVILDTNILISLLISGLSNELDQKIRTREIIPIFSELSFQELIEVVVRPKFRRYFNAQDVQRLVELMRSFGEFIEVTSQIEICRDPDDNFLLALAKDSKVKYLVTGDEDLLILKKFEETRILTVTDFLTEIQKTQAR